MAMALNTHFGLLAPTISFSSLRSPTPLRNLSVSKSLTEKTRAFRSRPPRKLHRRAAVSAALDLTEDNIRRVLADVRTELSQLFDTSVGITGQVDLAELDGPYVKISLKGKFWHTRATVLARIGNYLKNRIPEILEVDIEDEKQLDDSPENF